METVQSCQGGEGHAFPRPTVRFWGEMSEGYRATAVLLTHGLRIRDLIRCWRMNEYAELVGPRWEVTFYEKELARWVESRLAYEKELAGAVLD